MVRRLTLAVAVGVGGAAWALAAAAWGGTVYVSPAGSDSAEGTRAAPVRSLEAARDRLRASPGDGGEIVLMPGLHSVRATFELGAKDAGVMVKSEVREGEGRARVAGGVVVPAGAWAVVSDPAVLARIDEGARGRLVSVELATLGVSAKQWPALFVGNGGLVELYAGGERLPMSRWPNGTAWATMKSVRESGMKPAPGPGVFEYRGEQPARWLKSVEEGNAWLVGFWRVPWVAQAVRVGTIDTTERTITLGAPVPMGIGSKYSKEVNGTRVGDGKEPWHALNLLEEIDTPGEWCVDFARGRLYLLPPEGFERAEVVIADVSGPVIRVKGAAGARVEDLDVHGGLGAGVEVDGSNDVTVAGVRISGAGAEGIKVSGGARVAVVSCDVSGTGGTGIHVAGGDRKSLTPSGHTVLNNHLTDTGRTDRSTYALRIDGVGVRAAHNLIHDVPLGGILYAGNDHLIELNEIHNLGLEGGDLGGLYVNADWAGRGNILRHNLVHHSGNANGVYLDDGRSGDVVEGNIFYKVRAGLFVSGGHQNRMAGNIVIDTPIGLHVDDRGKARGYTRDNKGVLTRFLNTLDLTAEPWRSKYPGLHEMLAAPEKLPTPTSNDLGGNIWASVAKPENLSGDAAQIRRDNRVGPDLTVPSESFTDLARLDFTPRPDAPAELVEALARIPLGSIGLFADAHRRSLPTPESTGRFSARPPRQVFDSEIDRRATDGQLR